MLFHTWTFLIFFPIVFLGYLAFKKTSLRVPWLLAASYVFYGSWNPFYLLLTQVQGNSGAQKARLA